MAPIATLVIGQFPGRERGQNGKSESAIWH